MVSEPVQETSTTGPGPAGADRPVVVGYDTTPHSRRALDWAAAEAVRRGVSLRVVYAANFPGMAPPSLAGPGILELDPHALEAVEQVAEEGARIARDAHPTLQVEASTEVTAAGPTMVRLSEDAGLLVIGSRGLGRVAGPLLGSVGSLLLGRAGCPVVVVRGERETARPGREQVLVVGVDGSHCSRRALDVAAARAAGAGARLEVVCSVEEDQRDPASSAREDVPAPQAVVDSALERVRSAHPGVEVTGRVEESEAEQSLAEASATADLVVVGTRGRGAIRGMLLGSVGRAVVQRAECPVMVVNEQD